MSLGSWTDVLRLHTETEDGAGLKIPTGFHTIDKVLKGGMRTTNFYQLLGRTGTGKTSLACNMLYNALSPDYSIAVASLEMSMPEVQHRMLSIHAGIPEDEAEKACYSTEIREDIMSSLEPFKNFYINDTPGMTIEDIDAWVQDINTVAPPVRLCMVDHLSLVGGGVRDDSAAEISRITKLCKEIAKYEDMAVLGLHQASREKQGSVRDEGHLPLSRSRAKYGGEEDATVMFGVYRPCLDPELSDMAREALEQDMMVQVMKVRFGREMPGGLMLNWALPTMRITEPGHARTFGSTASAGSEDHHPAHMAPPGAAPGAADDYDAMFGDVHADV